MNARALSNKAKYISSKENVSTNLIINHYFFDSILKRISISKYRERFVLKGGYLLSIQFGIATRTTNDLDLHIDETRLDKDLIFKEVEEILSFDVDDSIEYEIRKVEDIKDCEGVKFKILCKLENIRHNLSIDVAVGDPVIPSIIEKEYVTLVDNKVINLNTYPYETILAEKIQTVISLGTASSRSKDLFDLYILNKLIVKKLDLDIIKEAVYRTFNYRKTDIDQKRILKTVQKIEDSEIQSNLWNNYVKKHYFAKDIEYNSLMKNLKDLINLVFE